MIKNKERDPHLDAVKGALILCIVLEHNSLLTSNYNWIRPFCDAFAAGCFLIFTFAWPIKKLPFFQYIDKYFAYYWPYIIFITSTTILNYIVFTNNSLTEASTNFVKALLLASPEAVKTSSGFMYLWFLPALSLLYLIRYFTIERTKTSIAIATVFWLSIGIIEDEVLILIPFSLHVIAFIFFIGLIYKQLHNKLIKDNIVIKLFCISSFILCSIASNFVGWELFLAGGIIPSLKEPFLLAYYSFFMLIAIPAIYHFLSFTPSFINKLFIYLGRNSLLTYLIHPLIFVAFTQIIPIIDAPFFSFVYTLILCLLFTFLFEKFSIFHRIIFPQKLSDLYKKEMI